MVWKEIPNFSKYEASDDNHGIRNKKSGKVLKRTKPESGYIRYCIINNDNKKKWVLEHILVANTFIDNSDNKPQVNHKDMNKSNNHISNLEFVTRDENMKHRYENSNVKKSGKAVIQIKDNKVINEFESIKQAFEETGVNMMGIIRVCKKMYGSKTAGGFVWKYKENNDDLEREVWKKIKDSDIYLVSNMGRVKNKKTGNILKGHKRNGYISVRIEKSFLVHRLVAFTFLDNPENKSQVNHLNGVKDDNRVSNLEWSSPSENTSHARDIGLLNIVTKREVYQLNKGGEILNRFENILQASRHVNGHSPRIIEVCRGRQELYKWKYVDNRSDDDKPKTGKCIYKLKDSEILEMYLSVIEASKIIGIGINTVRRYCKSGNILNGYKYMFVLDYEKISEDIVE